MRVMASQITGVSIVMPPPLGAGGIMFLGCLSVQSPKYPLSTCTWIHWSVRPTVTLLRHVRLERFPGICRRTHGGNALKFCMLMYRDHLQNWLESDLDYGHGLFIFLLLLPLWLSEMGQIWGFRAFPGERMEGMAWNFACWCIVTTFRID